MEPAVVQTIVEQRLGREPGIVAVWLFGSVARGTARTASDVDLGVLYERTPRSYLEQPYGLEAELEDALGRRVQVVVMNTAPADLVHRVLRDGQLLLERDRSRRVAFEVQSRNGSMTDRDLVLKKLALIETYLAELRTLAKPERLAEDVRERRFVEHTLQLAIQAALDVASHIVSDDHLGEPATNQELFTLLAGAGFIDELLALELRRAAAFRNVLVNGLCRGRPRRRARRGGKPSGRSGRLRRRDPHAAGSLSGARHVPGSDSAR